MNSSVRRPGMPTRKRKACGWIHRKPINAIMMALLLSSPGISAAETVYRQVLYQGRIVPVEVVEGRVFLQDDILAFPDEVQEPPASRQNTLAAHAVDEPLVGTLRLWKKTQLTYAFDADVPQSTRNLLREGAAIWHRDTSWRFSEVADRAKADVLIHANTRNRCAASPGAPKDGNQGFMNLSTDCRLRTMVHELGHVVGMLHEHQRPGRDKWVRLRKDTLEYIRTAYPDIYPVAINALRPEQYTPGQPFAMDTSSIMMYGSFPQRSPLREDLMARNLPLYTAPDGSLYEASPARLSNKDIAMAEYLATLATTVHTLLKH